MIRVTAPSRLHFGLFSFGQENRKQFGGVGAMVERPNIAIEIGLADQVQVSGPLADRVLRYAEHWAAFHQRDCVPPFECQVLHVPGLHSGLGVGTQLGLAVARGLEELFGPGNHNPQSLATSVGRGERSAVGTYGFHHGGLIIESGKYSGESLSQLSERNTIPNSWRFVLVTPSLPAGLSGGGEQQAFQKLPPVPQKTTESLESMAHDTIAPALRERNFSRFAEGIYQYGRLAGSCFASVQGGPYNGSLLEHLVTRMRAAGYCGVGQSSWGPTLFAATPTADEAAQLSTMLAQWPELSGAQIVITAANNVGARVQRLPLNDCTVTEQRAK